MECLFLRPLCQLHVFASSLDWFTALCMKFVFGQTGLFNFFFGKHSIENCSYLFPVCPHTYIGMVDKIQL